MNKQVYRLFCALMLMLALSPAGLAQSDEPGMIEEILAAGTLRCGVNYSLPGFAVPVDEAGTTISSDEIVELIPVDASPKVVPPGITWQGFDVDVCRAVAAAILGEADAVTYVPLNANQRVFAFDFDEIDMLSRNTTWTLSRNNEWDVIFAPTTFYDGASVMVRRDSNIDQLAGLADTSTCVARDTTTEKALRSALNALNIPFEIAGQPSTNAAFDTFLAGGCDAVATDRSGLASLRTTLDNADDYLVFTDTFSKEPLGPASPADDSAFADVIRWVVYGLIEAEELGIRSDNIDTFLADENPAVQRLLGTGGAQSGDLLGIRNNFMEEVIRQVGNYQEIFDRHLGPDTPLNLERGLNRLYTEGGLLYAPPFR